MRRLRKITVRFSEEEMEALQLLAIGQERTVAELIRRWLSLEVDKHIAKSDSAKEN